jgi:hypothetical protein
MNHDLHHNCCQGVFLSPKLCCCPTMYILLSAMTSRDDGSDVAVSQRQKEAHGGRCARQQAPASGFSIVCPGGFASVLYFPYRDRSVNRDHPWKSHFGLFTTTSRICNKEALSTACCGGLKPHPECSFCRDKRTNDRSLSLAPRQMCRNGNAILVTCRQRYKRDGGGKIYFLLAEE